MGRTRGLYFLRLYDPMVSDHCVVVSRARRVINYLSNLDEGVVLSYV